jgi:hypothetical protein
MWALPLDEDGFRPQVYNSSSVDLVGDLVVAVPPHYFWKNFVEGLKERELLLWAHVDWRVRWSLHSWNCIRRKG